MLLKFQGHVTSYINEPLNEINRLIKYIEPNENQYTNIHSENISGNVILMTVFTCWQQHNKLLILAYGFHKLFINIEYNYTFRSLGVILVLALGQNG
jgi:hypothetical protein